MNLMLALTLLASLIDPETAVLSNRFGRAEVALYGGFVTHYVPAGGEEVVAEPVPFFRQEKGGQLVGGIPLCWPWFVNQGPKGLPPNGLTRYQKWRVKSRADGDGRSTLTLEADDTPETRAIWPHRYHAELDFALDRKLSIAFRVRNTGDAAYRCTDGFHSYFRVGEAHRCMVRGTDGLRYFNRADAALGYSRTWSGDFAFGEMDFGYRFREGPHAYDLVDPVLRRTLRCTYRGNALSCIWNPGTRNPDFRASWRSFVCVEGANLSEDRYELAPGATHGLSMSVEVLPPGVAASGRNVLSDAGR